MAKAHGFNEEGARRIVKTVRDVEQYPADIARQQQEAKSRRPFLPMTLGFAQATIAEGATGEFKFAAGTPGSEAENEDGVTVTAANNSGRRIWSGSKCVLARLMVDNANDSVWHAISTNSATHVIATVNEGAGVTGADATYDVDNVIAQRGFFPDTEISDVQNTHTFAFDDDATVQLQWNENDGAWDTLQGDCPA